MAITNDPNEARRRREQEYMRMKGMAAVQANPHMGLGGAVIGPNPVLSGVYTGYEFDTTPHTMIYHASVERAENGYILKVTHKQGETPKIYVAKDTEELQRVFIAAIVAERIGK